MNLFSMTRKQFMYAAGTLPILPFRLQGARKPVGGDGPKVLLIVAHPDDEYTFAATVYRITKELQGTVDQVVITNGEGGYRYSQLAESVYGIDLTREGAGRAKLPAIRKRETLAAGRILGIRDHYFLAQKDGGYTLDPDEALRDWNTDRIASFLDQLLVRERYDFVFVLLPTAETHGHHQTAARLACEAVRRLEPETKPVVLGGEPAKADDPAHGFAGQPAQRIGQSQVFRFDRRTSFGPQHTLNYQIVVNWAVAEHKSQGLFQTDFNGHDEERFWILPGGTEGARATQRTERLFAELTDKGRTQDRIPTGKRTPIAPAQS
jgi:N-acetylglucosamine malate deacetylase 2